MSGMSHLTCMTRRTDNEMPLANELSRLLELSNTR